MNLVDRSLELAIGLVVTALLIRWGLTMLGPMLPWIAIVVAAGLVVRHSLERYRRS